LYIVYCPKKAGEKNKMETKQMTEGRTSSESPTINVMQLNKTDFQVKIDGVDGAFKEDKYICFGKDTNMTPADVVRYLMEGMARDLESSLDKAKEVQNDN